MPQSSNSNRRIVLAERPNGLPDENTLRLEETEVLQPGAGEMLLRTIYLSLDPYMRGRMNDAKSYAEPVKIEMTVATYNPASFSEIENANRAPGHCERRSQRLKQVRAQLHEAGVVLAGLQEVRGREQKRREDGYFHLCTGGRNHNHGVALLASTTTPYAKKSRRAGASRRSTLRS